MKLILFGDSLLAQFGKDRIAALETLLQGCDVYNCAAGGWDSGDAVRKSPYIAELQPEAVVISLGINDASPWKQVPLESFARNLDEIFVQFRESSIIYFSPPPVNEARLNRKDEKLTNDLIQEYYEAAKRVCARRGVRILDGGQQFKPMLGAGQDYHTKDGIHLNDFAYSRIISALASMLKAA